MIIVTINFKNGNALIHTTHSRFAKKIQQEIMCMKGVEYADIFSTEKPENGEGFEYVEPEDDERCDCDDCRAQLN